MARGRQNRRVGRSSGARRALISGLAQALLSHGKIETSVARAKALRAFMDRSAKVAGGGGVAGLRRLVARLGKRQVAVKLVELAKRKNGNSITRVVRIGRRPGDNSPRARVELIVKEVPKTPDVSKSPKAVR